MSEAQKKAPPASGAKSNEPLPDIRVPRTKKSIDWATILGLSFAIGLIFMAIALGNSNANFFNAPALMIVLLGTIAATSISYTPSELTKATKVIGHSMVLRKIPPGELATALVSLSVVARKRGLLALSGYEDNLKRFPFLQKSMQMAVDGYKPEAIYKFLNREILAIAERHKRSAGITRRAAEIAPAMGLIGTLVGLVQMLADLENPETIGPAMAVALLTTFYGAIIGTIVMAPLATKLEKNSADETLTKTLVAKTAVSIAAQESPRQLEMSLNSDLPPSEQINYFDKAPG